MPEGDGVASEEEIKAWMQGLGLEIYAPNFADTGYNVDLHQLLKHGVNLCKILNRLKPGLVGKVHTSSSLDQPSRRFLCVENVERFLGACKTELKMNAADLFDADAFVEGGDEADKAKRTLFVLSQVAAAEFKCGQSIEDARKALKRASMAVKAAAPPKLSAEDYRAKIVAELKGTEHSYVSDLIFLIQGYMRPIKQEGLLSKQEFKNMFANITSIFDFQKQFFKRISEQTRLASHDQRIGKVFTDHSEAFKVYTMYCANHPKAVAVLMEAEKRKDWKAYSEKWQKRSEKFFDPASYLIKPIQRILKYPLLLRELCKHTPADHPDKAALDEAFETMAEVSTYINNMKRRIENMQVMVDLASSIDNWVGPSFLSCGQLVKDGMVSCWDGTGTSRREAMYMILCEKTVVFCKAKTLRVKKKWEYRSRASLENLLVCDAPQDASGSGPVSFPWQLMMSGLDPITRENLDGRAWTFYSPNAQDKESWMAAFASAVNAFYNQHSLNARTMKKSDSKRSVQTAPAPAPAPAPAAAAVAAAAAPAAIAPAPAPAVAATAASAGVGASAPAAAAAAVVPADEATSHVDEAAAAAAVQALQVLMDTASKSLDMEPPVAAAAAGGGGGAVGAGAPAAAPANTDDEVVMRAGKSPRDPKRNSATVDAALKGLDDIMALLGDDKPSAKPPAAPSTAAPTRSTAGSAAARAVAAAAAALDDDDDMGGGDDMPDLFAEKTQDVEGVRITSVPSVYPEMDKGLLLCDYDYVVENTRDYDVQVVMEFAGNVTVSRASPVRQTVPAGDTVKVCRVSPSGDKPEESAVTMSVKIFPAKPEVVTDELQGVKMVRKIVYTETTTIEYEIVNTKDVEVLVEIKTDGDAITRDFDSTPKSVPANSTVQLGSVTGNNISTGWSVKYMQ